jgi:hypothetical protein
MILKMRNYFFFLQLFLLAATIAGCSGGGGETCGAPHDGGNGGVQAAAGGTTFTYGNFTSVHAGDCGRESITIDSTQIVPAPEPFHLVLCIARADHIGGDPLPLAGDFGDGVAELVDTSARAGDCTIALDFAGEPTGTATFAGYCDEGGASYTLTLAGTAPGIRTCGADAGTPMTEPVTIQLSGSANLVAQ